MNLLRGVCFLCQNNNKIIIPQEAEYITSKLSECLGNQIDVNKFLEIKSKLKVCPFCLHDFLMLSELRQNIDYFVPHQEICSLCSSDENLLYIKGWKEFGTLLEHITTSKLVRGCVCINCTKYLYMITKIKNALIKQFPELCMDNIKNKKRHKQGQSMNELQLDISNEKTLEKHCEQNSINNISDALKHLSPLKYTINSVNNYKLDKKLYEQIAYVKLEYSNALADIYLKQYGNDSLPTYSISSSSNESQQGYFKIKLKASKSANLKAIPKTRISKIKGHEYEITSLPKRQLYVKLFRIEQLDICGNNTTYDYDNTACSTPTDELSNSKARKSVSFSDILSVERKEQKKHNIDGTPLKSLLKKSRISLIFNDSGTNDESNAHDNGSEDISTNSEAAANSYEEAGEVSEQVGPPYELESKYKQKPDTTNNDSTIIEPMDNSSDDEDQTHALRNGEYKKSESEAEKQLLKNVLKSPDSSNTDFENASSLDNNKANADSEEFVLELSDEDAISQKNEEYEVSSTSPEKCITYTKVDSNLNAKVIDETSSKSNNQDTLIENSDTDSLQHISKITSKQPENVSDEFISEITAEKENFQSKQAENSNEESSAVDVIIENDDLNSKQDVVLNNEDSDEKDPSHHEESNDISPEDVTHSNNASVTEEKSVETEGEFTNTDSIDSNEDTKNEDKLVSDVESSAEKQTAAVTISDEIPSINVAHVNDNPMDTDENQKEGEMIGNQDILDETSNESSKKRPANYSDDEERDYEPKSKKIKLDEDIDESIDDLEQKDNTEKVESDSVNKDIDLTNTTTINDSKADTDNAKLEENLKESTVSKESSENNHEKMSIETLLNDMCA